MSHASAKQSGLSIEDTAAWELFNSASLAEDALSSLRYTVGGTSGLYRGIVGRRDKSFAQNPRIDSSANDHEVGIHIKLLITLECRTHPTFTLPVQ